MNKRIRKKHQKKALEIRRLFWTNGYRLFPSNNWLKMHGMPMRRGVINAGIRRWRKGQKLAAQKNTVAIKIIQNPDAITLKKMGYLFIDILQPRTFAISGQGKPFSETYNTFAYMENSNGQ